MASTRRVLITGGAGMLATDLARYLETVPGYGVTALPHDRLEVTSSSSVEDTLDGHQPHVVVNTAVYHVEDSEANPFHFRPVFPLD